MSTASVGARLGSARRMLGLATAEVAAAVGIGAAELEAIEADLQVPPPELIARFARLFRRSEAWVRGEQLTVPSPASRNLCAANLSTHDQQLVEEFANFLEGRG